jgi:sigma-B regulation protein RsbU (phosphoserine phosphatase)
MLEPESGNAIVVAHTDAAARAWLVERLAEGGYTQVIEVDAPEAALQALRDRESGLLVLDLGDPTRALAVIADVRKDPELEILPIIVLNRPDQAHVVQAALDAGADDFLSAPLSPTLVRSQVAGYLQIGARRRAAQRREEREALLKLERDVQIGRQIQAGFLPAEIPQPPGWEIAARFRPAREVAGDFYDAFTLTQGRRVAVIISDVCDKGVGAALFMALFRSLFRAFSQQNFSMRWADVLDDTRAGGTTRQRLASQTGAANVKNALEMTNDYMARNHSDSNMFATTFFGIFDPATGLMTYVNGGHNPPVLLNQAGEVTARLKPTGPAPGMLPNADYRIGQVALNPGDILYMFTDGVTDARNLQGRLFTEARTLELLAQPTCSARQLLDRIDDALIEHIGRATQFDDITMLAVRRLPAPQG